MEREEPLAGGTVTPVVRSGDGALLVAIGVYLLGVVYLGAYVRHAGLSLACADWPLCNGQLVPSLDGSTGVVFAHRLAALGAVVALVWLALRVRTRSALSASLLVIAQSLSGAVVVWTQLGLFSALAHAGIVALLFGVLAQMGRAAFASPERNEFDANVYPLSDAAARGLQPSAAPSGQPHVLATTRAPLDVPPGRGPVADHSRR